MTSSRAPGKIITFYSYKGGTGRSMALANVAWILASQGKRVLVIDWDLEAPGLHRYYHPFLLDRELTATEGLINFLTDYTVEATRPAPPGEPGTPAAGAGDTMWCGALADISRYAVSLDWAFPAGGAVDLVPAGRQGPSYATLVNAFDWQTFYERLGGGAFLEEVKKQARAEYDYVLIDSRTGVSDTAGICTVQMPDVLVVCFTLNFQSIEGSATVAASAYKQRQQSGLVVFPVPMRVELGEKEKLDWGRQCSQNRFAAFLEHLPEEKRKRYWGEVEVFYYPYYAYEEILATFAEQPAQVISLLPALERLTGYLTNGEVSKLEPLPEPERQEALARFARQARTLPNVAALLRGNAEAQTLHDQVTERHRQWLADRRPEAALDAALVNQLREAPDLFLALMGQPQFRLFWDESVNNVQRQERQETLLNLLRRFNQAQLVQLIAELELPQEYLPPPSEPIARIAAEILRLVEQRGGAELDRLNRMVQAMLAPRPAAVPLSAKGVSGIIPKGLRSFDANDADFFLDLLPGPRDRDGLPDSIRFWKSRIESLDTDEAFAVGVLFGPSGCGKSSLVKAGLLPRLAYHVVSVYVEATPADSEARLLKALRKKCPGLPGDLDLTGTIAFMRQGKGLSQGQKVLIVLDQFEQWLHGQRGNEDTRLVRALRQCDGEHVQCVVTVRDDFWLTVSRFMSELNTPLVQGRNCALVDLFDLIHARSVLVAFGRAFGRLEQNPTKEQESFLDQAVQSLSEDGRVSCVRLALFVEMVKGKVWTPANLKEVGGTEGVGVTFLEEMFSSPMAGPRNRLHQNAAQAILKSLLPEAGTNIKGHMRSRQELLAASGYGSRPRDFDVLLSLLDSELRLITPTDPGSADESTSLVQVGDKYYQLTQDYLVPSLRDWLTRKQKETRRGRAELLVADRAAAWTARPENRQLPSLLLWFQITLLTQKRNWTAPQRKLMQEATRYHLVRVLAVAVLIAVATFSGLTLRGKAVEERQAAHAAGLVQRLLDAEIAAVPAIVADMQDYRRWTDPLLRQADTEAKRTREPGKQLRASLALLPVDPTQVEYLYSRLLDADPNEVPVIRNALASHKGILMGRLWAVVEKRGIGKQAQRLRAACALAAFAPDDPRWEKISGPVVEELVGENPVFLSVWMHALRPVRAALLAPLRTIFQKGVDEQPTQRTLATVILANYAADQPLVLADLLQDADGAQFAVLFPLVKTHQELTLAVLARTLRIPLEAETTEDAKERLAQRQANAGVALLRLGGADGVWPLLRYRPDPRVRSYLIDRFNPLGADPELITRRLEEEPDVTIRRALLVSLGDFDPDRLIPSARKALITQLWQLYRDDYDPGIHGAAQWFLRQWKQEAGLYQTDEAWARDREGKEKRLEAIKQLLAKEKKASPQWYVNGQGQTMVVIPGPVEFLMGSPQREEYRRSEEEQHRVRIGRSFAIAARELTVEQYLRFRKDHDYIKRYAPTVDCPVNAVSWYDAAAYCNWLSDREGIPKNQWCYLPNANGEFAEGMKMAPDYLQLSGYRLPTEAEWEYTCRAGSITSRYFGETAVLLGRYAWYTENSQDRGQLAVSSLRPNELGLFDMLGNAAEWCQTGFTDSRGIGGEPGEAPSDNKAIENRASRVLRGGDFTGLAPMIRSASRMGYPPSTRSVTIGFRVARTHP